MAKRTDLAIVNRSFWPQNQVIGEGLLQFAELAAKDHSVCIITQTTGDLAAELRAANRAQGIEISACLARTTSASNLLWRMLEAVGFMCWVLFSLIRAKPAKVYVSTDPPVVVPFIVALYCRLWRARYVYHLQDIHPEAANIVLPLNPLVFSVLRGLDNFALCHAEQIITLSANMADFIKSRSSTKSPIHLLDNPAVEAANVAVRDQDVVYCGNAGRLQRIPLVMTAISQYAAQGGLLRFSFAGGGVHAADLRQLAANLNTVEYFGVLPASEAAALVNRHRWALLPIDDEVTSYAFPSKSSSYALSGAGIIAVCGSETSVAKWVQEHQAGVVCEPEVDALVKCFMSLEKRITERFTLTPHHMERLKIDFFAKRLVALVVSEE